MTLCGGGVSYFPCDFVHGLFHVVAYLPTAINIREIGGDEPGIFDGNYSETFFAATGNAVWLDAGSRQNLT
jgi:hypothetical protein